MYQGYQKVHKCQDHFESNSKLININLPKPSPGPSYWLTKLFRCDSDWLFFLWCFNISALLSPRSVIRVILVLSLLRGWLVRAALCNILIWERRGQQRNSISARSACQHNKLQYKTSVCGLGFEKFRNVTDSVTIRYWSESQPDMVR